MAPSSSRAVAVAAVSASLLTISLVATAVYLRRRRRLRETRLNGDEGAASPCCSMELHAKPQYRFQRVLADNSYRPFQHYKAEGKEKGVSIKAHPYEDAIASLLESPLLFSEFVASKECPLMSSTFVWVDTLQKLECLVETLQKERAFAVDTEQHSLRSFLGFTALMQISTQTEDFLVDTIILHDVMSILCPVFADPFILKVFHGADNDILWLQRDFHIYVVNLFDTAKACEVLSKPHKSLAYLLRSYCGVITNKMLQREDWRIRPLSAEMVNYARTDAHYLLFIASRLVSELANQSHDDSMSEAYRRSNAICLQLYVKEKESFPGDSAAASIFSRHFNTQELSGKNDHIRELVRRLCTWRDLMARIHDESLRYVLSDEAIASLSIEVQHGPSSIHDCIVQADLNKDNPLLMPSPSPVVEGHIRDICCIFEKITEDPDDVFREIFQRYLYQTKTCPLSIYNYVLLNELNVKLTKTLFPEQSGRKLGAAVGRKSSRQLFVQKFSCKSPVYHNCRIFASDGRLLCYCDRRKLEWYLRRDLAKLVEDDPPAIMLLFEPKGRPEDEDNDFYIQSKKNICVGCGERNHYLRYRIIPSCYRMHFPEHLKSHRSHDIVLLCVDCHEIAHSAAEKYKRQVAEEFGIPLFVKKVMESGENEVIALASTIADNGCMNAGVSPLQLRTAAMALVRHGSTMPPKRREELREIIKEYFGGREISENDLEKALLVGMSPAERRRLERKRGLPFGSSEKHAVHSINESVVEKSLESFVSLSNNLHTASESIFADDANINPTENVGTGNRNLFGYVSNPAESTGQDLEGEVIASENVYIVERSYSRGLASGGENGSSHENNKSALNVSANYYSSTSIKKRSCSCILETANCICSDAANNFESRDLSKANDCSNVSYRSTSRKYSKKVSLLGHGPHGSQVVRRILEKNGEDGILQFCQRWRHVFVESIHPRFLPAGWDIRHSGKREFGKYSVYNPSKTSEADDQQDCSFLAD